MQIRVTVGMLAALVLVLLAPSTTEGLVLTKCEMEQQLNQTLPANISSSPSGNMPINMSNDAAHIVCYAELVSGLNTSKVSQPTKTPDHHPEHDEFDSTEFNSHKGRKQRSAGFKPGSKPESHGESHPSNPPSEPHTEPHKQNFTGGNHTEPPNMHQGHNESSETSEEIISHKGRKQRSAGFKPEQNPRSHGESHPSNPPSEPHTEAHKHNTTGGNHTEPPNMHHGHNESSETSEEIISHKGRKQRSAGFKPEQNPRSHGESHPSNPPSEPHTEAHKHNTTGGNHTEPPNMHHGHNESSETSAEINNHKPHTMAPSHVSQTTHHGHNGAESKPKSRNRRSYNWPKPKPKPEPKPDNGGKHDESGETFYGVFQLSDRIACASGNKTTLNLCGLTCDKLIDDDITDDIACLRTLISKFKPVKSLKGDEKEYINELHDQIYQKKCAGATDAQTFSGC